MINGDEAEYTRLRRSGLSASSTRIDAPRRDLCKLFDGPGLLVTVVQCDQRGLSSN